MIEGFRALVGPSGTATLFSILPLAPASGSFNEFCFREKEKRELTNNAPYAYGGRKPRLATARELMVRNVTYIFWGLGTCLHMSRVHVGNIVAFSSQYIMSYRSKQVLNLPSPFRIFS